MKQKLKTGLALSLLAVLLTGLATSHAFADSNPCTSKVSELKRQGKVNIVCNENAGVDFGNRTFSSDYQNTQSEPLTAPVGWIMKEKKNKTDPDDKFFERTQKRDYGINNLYYLTEQFRPALEKPETLTEKDRANAYGAPTTSVLLSAFQQAYPNDKDIAKFITEDLNKNLTRDVSASPWNGRCLLWSVWNTSEEPLDLQFKTLLRGMERGRLCDGNWPLSAGVLKEIWTSLTLEPREDNFRARGNYALKELRHNYSDTKINSHENIEDANLALVKLQDFGTGSDFQPESLVELARQAKGRGEHLIFDMNAGNAVWNQPIEKVIELTYEDPNPGNDQKYLTLADLNAGPGGAAVFEQLTRLENNLKAKALNDDNSRSVEFCRARELLDLPCNDLANTIPLTVQVDELKKAQALAISKGLLQAAPQKKIVHHQILIQYGTEGDFGDSKNVPAKTRVLDFVKVGDRRASWSAPSRKLSEACADGNFGERDAQKDSLFANIDESCLAACKRKPEYLPRECGNEREIFTGSLPPKNLKIMRKRDAGNAYTGDELKKLEAEKKLIQLIQDHCPSYDQAARFLDRLKLSISQNQITPQDQAELMKLYPQAKGFLSANFIEESVYSTLPSKSVAQIPGLAELKQKLR